MTENFSDVARDTYQNKFRSKLDRFEKEAIVKTLRMCKYNLAETSRWLGYSPHKLKMRMRALRIRVIAHAHRKQISYRRWVKINKRDWACLDDLMDLWIQSCSTKHGGCLNCPKNPDICTDITDKLINRIYDKNGK